MSQGGLIVACDFGTATFRALATEIGPGGQLTVLGCAEEPAAGYQDGDFVNLGAGSEGIARVIASLEAACEIFVNAFTYNIAGSHLRSVLHNIEHAIETARCRPFGEEVDVLAAGEALVTPADRDKGAMLVDVGGRATNWAVYRKGAVVATGAVPLGGHHLSNDLAHGLRIPLDEAEKVKRLRGVVLRSLVEHVPVETLFEDERPEETPGLVAAILEPRLEEILTLVKNDFGDRRELAGLAAGVILTGGGSRCRGSAQLCEEIFDLPAECRWLPPGLRGADRLTGGQWATAVGLSLCVARDSVPDAGRTESGPRPGLRGWFRSLLRRDDDEDGMAAEA